VDGTLMICHGGSSPRAIRNAIKSARLAILNDVNGSIRDLAGNYQNES
jgi:fatty acid/phospholipid biosynthesis enzyme